MARTTPAGIMHAVDRDFLQHPRGAFIHDRNVRRARYEDGREAPLSGAGHPPLLIARGDGATESIAIDLACRLGWSRLRTCTETEMELRGGDLFLLYTDGLYGVGEGDDRRLAPATVATTFTLRAGQRPVRSTRFCAKLRRRRPNVVPPDDIAALAVRRLEGKINFSKAKTLIALLVASVLMSGHAENQS